MQMDSYFYAGCFHDESPFYPHAAAPPSPELPFGLIAELEPPFAAAQAPRPTAFQDPDYCVGAGPELLPPPPQALGAGAPSHMHVMVVGGRDLEQDHQAMETEEEPRRRQQLASAVESSRGFRHMMRERQRREKLSQSYADLHALVSARSRGDKNSIVQSAAIYIRELKGAREQLQRRNEELKARILGHDAGQQCVKLQFEVDDPASGVDSMILRTMGVRARGIRSSMAGRRLCTEMNVETTIAAAEVAKAVEEALLQEVERKQQHEAQAQGFPGTTASGSKGWGAQPQASSHVQNVF